VLPRLTIIRGLAISSLKFGEMFNASDENLNSDIKKMTESIRTESCQKLYFFVSELNLNLP